MLRSCRIWVIVFTSFTASCSETHTYLTWWIITSPKSRWRQICHIQRLNGSDALLQSVRVSWIVCECECWHHVTWMQQKVLYVIETIGIRYFLDSGFPHLWVWASQRTIMVVKMLLFFLQGHDSDYPLLVWIRYTVTISWKIQLHEKSNVILWEIWGFWLET